MTTLPATAQAASSPYGLEAHRVALLRRRRRALLAVILVGLLGAMAIIANSVKEGGDITTLGGKGSSVDVAIPEQPREKPTTLSISPGRTTVLDKPILDRKATEPRPSPSQQTGSGLNWVALLQILGPPVGGAIYAWRAGKKRFTSSLEQVNLGVYKGAMPFELHAATHRRYVFTTQAALAPLFGARAAATQVVQRTAARFERVR